MATMYVYNIPTNETVNLRKTASSNGTILVRVGYGKAVQANYYNLTWHSATYNGYSGYIMSKYLTSTDPNGDGGNTGTGTGTPTAGVIKGTSVRVRKEPNTTSTILTHVNTGDKVTYYAGESYSGDGYNWYRCTGSKWSGVGYIATNYVVKDDGSASAGSGDYNIQATIDTSKHGNGGTVHLRAKPWKSGSSITSIGNGKTIYVKNMTGTWLPAKYGTQTGYIMAEFVKGSTAYNMTGSENSGSGKYGLFFTGNRKLSSSEKKVNAQYILNYMRDQGWTKNAVCGMLGNMEVESYLSPGTWQSLNVDVDTKGFGLTQWTPATKYFAWACDEGYLYDNIDAQLERILHEVANPSLQWSSSKGGMSFSDFTHSTNTAADLAVTFCNGYEKPKSPDYTTRKENATSWYNRLT